MKKEFTQMSLFLFAVVLVVGLGSCSKSEKGSATAGKVTLTVGSNAQVLTSLDRLANLGYAGDDVGYLWGDPLVWSDHIGNYTPALALEWTISGDYRSYTFKLRQGVTFHNGAAFTARDVKKTYERLVEDKTLRDAGSWAGLDYVEVVDDYTAIIHLKEVMPTFYDECARIYIICESAYMADPVGYFQAPAGTGAYRVTGFDKTTGETRFVRHDGWWGWTAENKTNVDEIIYKFILEDTTRASALQAGDIDVAAQLTVGYLNTLNSSSYNIIRRSMDSHMHIGFQCEDGALFSDKNLRKAFSLAIDRQLIVDSVLESGGVVSTWPTPEGNRGYVAGYKYEYNPDQAKQLIAASKYRGEEIKMMITNGAFARTAEVAQAVQSMAREVGFNITLEPIEKATFDTRRLAGDYVVMLYRFNITSSDPLKEASVIIAKDEFGSHFANDNPNTPGGKMKVLGLALENMGDLEARTAGMKEFFALEMEEFAPFAYLYSPILLYCTQKSISNLTVFADGSADYRFAKKGI
jgi:peptide/nickel transport system substrate-binding protein